MELKPIRRAVRKGNGKVLIVPYGIETVGLLGSSTGLFVC